MPTKRAIGLFLAASCLVIHTAKADRTMLRLATPGFIESFVGNAPVKVSGGILVGAKVTVTSAEIAAEEIAINGAAGNTICLNVSTQDGRYSAENLYKASKSLGLVVFEFPTRHSDQLAEYKASEVAMLAREVDDCTGNELGLIRPVLEVSAVPSLLHLQINASAHKLKLSLQQNDQMIPVTFSCIEDDDAVRMSFIATCTASLPDELVGSTTLGISVKGTFTTVRLKPILLDLSR